MKKKIKVNGITEIAKSWAAATGIPVNKAQRFLEESAKLNKDLGNWGLKNCRCITIPENKEAKDASTNIK